MDVSIGTANKRTRPTYMSNMIKIIFLLNTSLKKCQHFCRNYAAITAFD